MPVLKNLLDFLRVYLLHKKYVTTSPLTILCALNLKISKVDIINNFDYEYFVISAYFTKEANPHSGKMEQVIHSLTDDKDPDVRAFFAEPQAYDSDGEPINDISVSFNLYITE